MSHLLRFLGVLCAVSFSLTALWVGAVLVFERVERLRRRTEPNRDPEVEALDALEQLWRMS